MLTVDLLIFITVILNTDSTSVLATKNPSNSTYMSNFDELTPEFHVGKIRELLYSDPTVLDLFQYIASNVLGCIHQELIQREPYFDSLNNPGYVVSNKAGNYATRTTYNPDYFRWSSKFENFKRESRGYYDKLVGDISQCQVDLPIGLTVYPGRPRVRVFNLNQMIRVDKMIHARGFNTSYLYNGRQVILSQLVPVGLTPDTIQIQWYN